MSQRDRPDKQYRQVLDFFAVVFGMRPEQLEELGRPSDALEQPKMSGVMAPVNQPEFWADAPWRVEPDRADVAVTFSVRDANIRPPAHGPWRLDMLKVEQRLGDGSWHKLRTFLPKDLPEVDAQGDSKQGFWVHETRIPLEELQNVHRGDVAHFRAVFSGSFPPYDKTTQTEIHLEVLLASEALPLGRAACVSGPRHWFYGDTHYHSAYTNDIKEFGGVVPEAREAARSVGLDWLVITDHSCDLDEVDAGFGGKTRWERLKEDLTSSQVSDDSFRCILGEEITLVGAGERYVHMLALGSMDDMVEGAFLREQSEVFEARLFKEAVQKVVDSATGYPADVPQRLFGQLHSFRDVLALLNEDTLLFAAHPYHVAQVPPAKWAEEDLANLRLTGHEFWNGRTRGSASLTTDPFSRSGWTNGMKRQKRDRARIAELRRWAERQWDPHLQAGVDEWSVDGDLPSRRPVFIGGSDAHGDFNYHVGCAWDYRRFQVDDNALGRVRTVIHLPDHAGEAVPAIDDILAALRKGACVVTDGPLLECSLAHNGGVAQMGEALLVSGGGDVEIKIIAHTTAEFGPVGEVEVVTYFMGQRKKSAKKTTVAVGQTETLNMDGLQGYCRVQAQSTGPDGERFCCFSNPIWVRAKDGEKRCLGVSFFS